jgi:hypothetical protein
MTEGKADDDKDRWDLLPWREFREVVQVLTYGAQKYSAHNWKQIPNARERYFAAALRHMSAWREGEITDESTYHHLAHAICCILFLMWYDTHKYEQTTENK